jgi:hypothetical protein
MNPEGTVYNAMGRINRLSVLCIDAYGVAVKNGFKGTVDEWLASLKGDPPNEEQIAKAVADYFANNPASSAMIGEVTLLASKWVGSEHLYSQVVNIDGVTENSQVDLTPSVEQLVVFYEKDLTFVTENEGGVVTVYAIGQKPTNDYVVQITVTEVNV